MSNQQKKFLKKKERERESRKKVLRRREAKRFEEKKRTEWEEKLERETNPNPVKRQPYRRGDPEPSQEQLGEAVAKDAEVKAKLEHNLAVLRALEQQWQGEQKTKLTLNKNLEAQGATTFKEKMDLMASELLDRLSDGTQKAISDDPPRTPGEPVVHSAACGMTCQE